METLKILIVDDEEGIREELGYFLQQSEYNVFKAESREEALKVLEHSAIDIAITDIHLGADSGLELLREIHERWPDTQVIMITAFGDEETILSALRYGAFDFFHKPFRLIDLETAIHRTSRYIDLKKRFQEVEHDHDVLQKQLQRIYGHPIIGESEHIREVKELIRKVASSPATSVLITGESGTGKELIAHSIHLLSERHEKLFYAINCSAIPEHLFESELFGHVRGAFTGADSDRIGWIQTANKGTLMLDEIADMPQALQVKLLRVLETGKIIPLGAREGKSVDVRFVAVTNRDLQGLVDQGDFRLDLFYRLNRFEIKLKPLWERKEDIPLLLDYYIEHFCASLRKPPVRLTPDALRCMIEYHYPGNVRELRNIIERGVILCDTGSLKREHLVLSHMPAKIESCDTGSISVDEILDLELLEKRAIQRAMELSGNNKTHAAKLLNITWFALDRRLKKYGW